MNLMSHRNNGSSQNYVASNFSWTTWIDFNFKNINEMIITAIQEASFGSYFHINFPWDSTSSDDGLLIFIGTRYTGLLILCTNTNNPSIIQIRCSRYIIMIVCNNYYARLFNSIRISSQLSWYNYRSNRFVLSANRVRNRSSSLMPVV